MLLIKFLIMNNYEILAQICGIVAIIVWNISIQNKKLEKILYFQFLANLLYSMEYFLLGAPIAGFMDFSSGCRCFVFYYKNKKKQPISKKWLFLFITLIIGIGILGYTSPLSLIPVFLTFFYTITSYSKTSNFTRIAFIITIFYTISSYLKKAKWIRIVVLIAAFIWIYYNYKVGAYVGIIGNIIEIISGVVSIYRFKKIKTVV